MQTGGGGGLGIGRKRATDVVGVAMQSAALGKVAQAQARSKAPAPRGPGGASADSSAFAADLVFAIKSKPSLIQASAAVINDLARSRVGEVLAPTEARVVTRPAPRWTFPSEPMVALRGAGRSLRHGHDGRGSADGKLTCRWPTHTITEISGLIAPDRFIRSLGNGSVPGEVLLLAREALLHDPYHDEWIAAALAPAGAGRTNVLSRLKAESVLRFGADGTYDGATVALGPKPRARRGSRAPAQPLEPGVREQQTLVADEFRRFSLYKGADPDLVGVTTWAQPWVPLWLEWQVAVEGVDPAALAAWRLGAVDVEHGAGSIDGGTVTLRGRALLTTGAAKTLHDAIDDWLLKEEALDKPGAGGGLIDDATETAYRDLDTAVRDLDLVTAALDGVRTQLLGLPVSDGLRRSNSGGTIVNPTPVAPPAMVLAGALRLERARLLDAFGRTLDAAGRDARQGGGADARRARREPCGAGDADTAAAAVALAVPPRRREHAGGRRRHRSARRPGRRHAAGQPGRRLPAARSPRRKPRGLRPRRQPDRRAAARGGERRRGVGDRGRAQRPGRRRPAPRSRSGAARAGRLRRRAGRRRQRCARRPNARAERAKESALSALLRAIDTTLWTVDTFASLGSEHVAGLVGRPIAVVRAQLRLELMPPTDIDLTDPARADEWAAAEQAAQRHAFPVRIGELTRSDDGVLGFFVDDDYTHFRLVDKAIAATATDAGRSRGQLGLYAKQSDIEVPDPIEHPYVDPAPTRPTRSSCTSARR